MITYKGFFLPYTNMFYVSPNQNSSGQEKK